MRLGALLRQDTECWSTTHSLATVKFALGVAEPEEGKRSPAKSSRRILGPEMQGPNHNNDHCPVYQNYIIGGVLSLLLAYLALT